MQRHSDPPHPNHVPGTMRGEEMVLDKGKEPGRRNGRKNYRSARDSTGVDAIHRQPILSSMPNIPPA